MLIVSDIKQLQSQKLIPTLYFDHYRFDTKSSIGT